MGVTLRRNSYPAKTNPLYHFDPETGYFGEHGTGNRHDVRLVYVDDDPTEETRALFKILTKGSEIYEVEANKRWCAILDDGSIITLRINHPTPEHAPAVMISVRKGGENAGIKTQKIHFIKKGTKKWKI